MLIGKKKEERISLWGPYNVLRRHDLRICDALRSFKILAALSKRPAPDTGSGRWTWTGAMRLGQTRGLVTRRHCAETCVSIGPPAQREPVSLNSKRGHCSYVSMTGVNYHHRVSVEN